MLNPLRLCIPALRLRFALAERNAHRRANDQANANANGQVIHGHANPCSEGEAHANAQADPFFALGLSVLRGGLLVGHLISPVVVGGILRFAHG
jgi:hypothetical protein